MNNDKIHIRLANCTVPLFVGIYDHEKPRPQPVIITIEATAALTQRYDDVKSSSMASVISYEKLFNYVTTELPKLGHVPLLESLAENIIAFCFEDPRIIETRVRLEKPDAFAGKALAGIEMRRSRA